MTITDILEIKNLSVLMNGKKILDDINFNIKRGEVVVIMGPNGAGKSTISNVIMGNPDFKIIKGNIFLNKEDITQMQPEQRARRGIFMSFQSPVEIQGVNMFNFLKTSYNLVKKVSVNISEFYSMVDEKLKLLKLDSKFKSREFNVGFSGGEKKRIEMLELLLLEPKFAILDEIDSGLDIDGLKIISENIKKLIIKNKMAVILITHHQKILDFINVDKVLILKKGKIVKTGDKKLSLEILKKGFNF